MKWIDDQAKAAGDIANLDDKEVGSRVMGSLALAMLMKASSTELIDLAVIMVRDIRAAERLKLQTMEKGKAITDSLYGALNAEEKR